MPHAFIVNRGDWYVVQLDPPTSITTPTAGTPPPPVLPQVASFLTYDHVIDEDRSMRSCCLLEAALAPRIILRHRAEGSCWKLLFGALAPFLFPNFTPTFLTESTEIQVAAEYGSVISSVSIPVQFARFITGITAIKSMVCALTSEPELSPSNIQDDM